MRSHTKETPFECSFCDSKFAYNSLLKVHLQRYHPIQKPYNSEPPTPNDRLWNLPMQDHRRTHIEQPQDQTSCTSESSQNRVWVPPIILQPPQDHQSRCTSESSQDQLIYNVRQHDDHNIIHPTL